MPTTAELLASRHAAPGRSPDLDAIAAELGADRVIYQAPPSNQPRPPLRRARPSTDERPRVRQELPDLCAAITEEAAAEGAGLTSLDCSCFDGECAATTPEPSPSPSAAASRPAASRPAAAGLPRPRPAPRRRYVTSLRGMDQYLSCLAGHRTADRGEGSNASHMLDTLGAPAAAAK